MHAFILALRRINKIQFFVTLCILHIAITYAINQWIISDELYFEALQDRLSYERIAAIINNSRSSRWLTFVITPVFFFIKISVITLIINTGVVLNENDIAFRQIFKIVLLCEAIFVIPPIFKLIWFGFVDREYSLEDLRTFHPLSAYHFATLLKAHVPSWLMFPLRTANVFELLYCTGLSLGVSRLAKINFADAFLLIFFTYILGLVLWSCLIAFMIINFA